MTSAFGGQHSIQLSYGCPRSLRYKENGPAMQSGPGLQSNYSQVATPPWPEQVPWRFL